MKWIQWIEPFGPNNEPVYMRVTEEVAIATQRAAVAKMKLKHFKYESDAQALEDFIAVNWAERIEL